MDLAADSDFGLPLPLSDAPPSVSFTVADDPPVRLDWTTVEPRATSVTRTAGRVDFEFFAFDGFDVVRVHGAADYYVWPRRIVCHLVEHRHRALVPVHLLGMVLSLWLERRGVLTLHASAVGTPAGAVALLASKGGGKTSTAAALVAAGQQFITDDLLALTREDATLLAHPAYPQMRMSAVQAEAIAGMTAGLDVVNPTTGKLGVPIGDGFGRFSPSPLALTAVYLPLRSSSGGFSIEAVGPREAFLEAVRHTFLPREVSELGLQRRRFAQLAHLASTIPFRRVLLPSGLDRLGGHVQRIVEDARAL